MKKGIGINDSISTCTREARESDIAQLHLIRNSVTENVLSDPDKINESDYREFLTTRGKGWVAEIDGRICGFAVVDLKENNVWALFVQPNDQGRGIGRRLQEEMLDWYFSRTSENVWLSTSPQTRAERFYRKTGWIEVGNLDNGEIKFEMSLEAWNYSKKPR